MGGGGGRERPHLIFLTGFFKVFNCLSHDLLVAKLHVYIIKGTSLNLLFSYLQNRKQRVRPNNTYTDSIDTLFGVHQRSTFGPLLFNIFLFVLFFFLHEIPVVDYAHDRTLYCTDLKTSNVLIKLEYAAKTLSQWFKGNRIKENSDKYHVLISNNKENFK